jgi:hypothetical protein
MTVIKVRDLAWARMRAPDLDAMEEFLTHFGLTRAVRTPTALYMRGTDPRHHLHVTEKGDPKFVGFEYLAINRAEAHAVVVFCFAGSAVFHSQRRSLTCESSEFSL